MPSEEDDTVHALVDKMSKGGTHEAGALQRGTFRFSRWSGPGNRVGIISSPSFNDPHSGEERQTFYRAMKEEEFRAFEKSEQLTPVDANAYMGISDSREYVTKYFDGPIRNDATHVVEFIVQPGVDVEQELLGLRVEKAESSALSFGLGPKQAKGVGGEYFNYLLKSRCVRWRLVEWKADPASKPKHKKK
jgi:hypothetical protein